MANQEQLGILNQGVEVWNKWRSENMDLDIDLSDANLSTSHLRHADLRKAGLSRAYLNLADLRGADLREADLRDTWLSGADLCGADLREADLGDAHLSEAHLTGADLRGADLRGATFWRADLSEVDLRGAQLGRASLQEVNLRGFDLSGADLSEANLSEADLSGASLKGTHLISADLVGANLSGADLTGANLVNANLVQAKIGDAKISNSKIYGVNVWDLEGEFDEQKDLVITPEEAPVITVDNVKVAQFLYLILNNEEIRKVINILTSKSVLILGRFALPDRKAILDALRNKLREYNLLPIVCDFDRPTDKDFTETIKTLAGLSYFVIADVTNPKSSPLELQATVPDYQIPFVPIIQEGESPFSMMVDLQKKYNWVLNTVTYDSIETLMKALKPLIVDPAMKKRQELRIIKAQEPEIISAKDFLEKGKE